MKNKEIKKATKTILFLLIKPFIVPVLIITILLAFACSITDIFYIAFNNEDKVDMKKEMKYYDTEKEYEKEEMKTFLSSVWDFVEKIFGGGEMSEETDWPVVRSLYDKQWIWTKKSSNRRCIKQSLWN